jgi:hypothetical protein
MGYFRKSKNNNKRRNNKTKKYRQKAGAISHRKTYRQHGWKFNKEQINHIIATIKLYRENEPFSNRQIKQYIKKLNDISQRFADRENYDIFYEQMVDLLHENQFKRWIDEVHEEQMEKVETDVESLDTEDEEDDDYHEFAHRHPPPGRYPHRR